MLATQNPVDLDYKGLSNAGTWFLGRLQTERDKARVIEGLEGASAQAGSTFNRQQMEATLAALGNRVFLMNNVHDDAPVVFQTRWAMSYLRGPLTRGQIKTLMDPVRSQFASAAPDERGAEATASIASRTTVEQPSATDAANRPILPAGIRERFVAINERVPDGYQLEYRPGLLGSGKVHFVRKARRHRRLARVLRAADRSTTRRPTTSGTARSIVQQDLATEDAARRPRPLRRFAVASWPAKRATRSSRGNLKEHLYRERIAQAAGSARRSTQCSQAGRRRKPTSAPASRRCWTSRLKRGAREARKAVSPRSWPTPTTALSRAEARVSTQRWQFFARIGSMLWVIVDTVLSALGKGLPGRRRSLDPAFRSVATERGQQSNAQVSVDKLPERNRRARSKNATTS